MKKAKEAMMKADHHHKMAHDAMKMEAKEESKKGKMEAKKTYKARDCKM